MGDRCLVDLTVLSEHVPRVLVLLKREDYLPNTTTVDDDEVCTVLSFEEVNYGTLPWLSELTNLGIAWDSRWHGGDEYGPGTKHSRFAADGTEQTVEFSDTEEGVIDCNKLLEFMQRPGITPDSIRTYILNHVESFNPLPWEGQVENGKRHLALKLIGGT